MTADQLKAPTKADRLYDLKEVAELMSLSLGEVRRLCADGEIATIKLGARRVVPAVEVRRLLYPDADRTYNANEVAELTSLTVPAVRKMFADGRIPTIKVGNDRVVTAQQMRRILTEGC